MDVFRNKQNLTTPKMLHFYTAHASPLKQQDHLRLSLSTKLQRLPTLGVPETFPPPPQVIPCKMGLELRSYTNNKSNILTVDDI